MQTVATLVNLAGQKLSVEGAKDPAEAQKAIDAARHMLPLVPEEAKPPIQNALDQIQMLYVRESPARRRTAAQGGAAAAVEDLDAGLVIGIFGGSGFYRFLDDIDRGAGRHALRPAVGTGPRRARSRAPTWRSCRATATSTRSLLTASTTGRTSGR